VLRGREGPEHCAERQQARTAARARRHGGRGQRNATLPPCWRCGVKNSSVLPRSLNPRPSSRGDDLAEDTLTGFFVQTLDGVRHHVSKHSPGHAAAAVAPKREQGASSGARCVRCRHPAAWWASPAGQRIHQDAQREWPRAAAALARPRRRCARASTRRCLRTGSGTRGSGATTSATVCVWEGREYVWCSRGWGEGRRDGRRALRWRLSGRRRGPSGRLRLGVERVALPSTGRWRAKAARDLTHPLYHTISGQGASLYANGDKYEGEWVRRLRHARGCASGKAPCHAVRDAHATCHL
jgi:hypothetical protein